LEVKLGLLVRATGPCEHRLRERDAFWLGSLVIVEPAVDEYGTMSFASLSPFPPFSSLMLAMDMAGQRITDGSTGDLIL
jgi:hypothetical protein